MGTSPNSVTARRSQKLVVHFKSFRSNFGVKAAQIADRKFIRIALIRMNLRSLTVDDFSELSRSKLLRKLLKWTTRFRIHFGINLIV